MNPATEFTIKKQQNWKLEPFDINSHRYTVRLAQNREEVEAALKLRFEIFNIELGEGLESSYKTQLDEDKYDEQCDHLLVIEKNTGNVIGTYRMQDDEMASDGCGFYTYSEFDIYNFSAEVLTNAVELGRACVHKDHRNGRVLYLLWRGLAKYLQLSKKRFLFGCCSLTSQNPDEGKQVYEYLQKENYMHPEMLIDVQPEFECMSLADNSLKIAPDKVQLPQLFRLYLDIGCKVCSPPALDSTFKTIDFLILLDIGSLTEQTKTLFFR